MVKDGAWQAKKKRLLPLAPVASRVSANQEVVTHPTKEYRTGSAKAHARNLAKLQLHLPREVLFFDPSQCVYHSHVDLGGWRVTDASLLQALMTSPEQPLLPRNYQNGKSTKTSFDTLTVDGSAHISVQGLRLLFNAAAGGGGEVRVLRLPQCQLLSRGGGELLQGDSLPHSLTELNVASCEWVDDRFLRTLTRHCPRLSHVSVSHCRRVTDYGVAAFGESYSAALTHLDVSHCTKLTDTALLALLLGTGSTLPPGGAPIAQPAVSARIKVLNAAGLPLVDGLTLLGLRGPCASRLEMLDMSGCTVLRVAALERLAQVRALIRITTLDLSRCSLVDDRLLAAMGVACPLLGKLCLAFCASITDIGVCRLVGESVTAGGGEFYRNDGDKNEHAAAIDEQEVEKYGDDMSRLGERGCRQLTVLDVTGCFQLTNRGISALGAHCSKLQSVTLDGVRRLNSSGVRSLLRGCSKLQTLRWSGILVRSSQEDIDIPGACAAFFSSPHIDETTITALAKSAATSLRTLHISSTECDANALASTMLLARGPSIAAYTLVDLDVAPLATDALCEALGACCSNLRTLRLSRSRYFSPTSFLAVLRGCPKLRKLELESCEQLRDETLFALSKAPCCPHLEALVLANDWQFTDVGVAALIRPAKSLSLLDVRHCPEISLPILQALAAARGHISEASRDGLTPRHPNIIAFLRRDRKRRSAAWRITRWLRCKLDARVSTKSSLERALAYFRRQKVAAARVQHWYRQKSYDRKLRQLIIEARRQRAERCKELWKWLRALCVLSREVRIYTRKFIAARERAALEKAEQLRLYRVKAATNIQRICRGWLGRRRAAEARHARELRMQQRERSATDLQRVFRGHRSRKSRAMLRHHCETTLQSAVKLESSRFLAGMQIQRVVRGGLGRRSALSRAVAVYELLQLRIARARQIQRAYRAYTARVGLHKMLFRGATSMQQVFRGFCGRRAAREIVLSRAYTHGPRILILMQHSIYTRELALTWKRKRDAGTIVSSILQRKYRGFCGRREARLRLAACRQRWYREDTGARAIQHFFRSIIILIRLARFKALLCLRRYSATKIQAVWRMWLAKALATSRRLRNDRRRQHTALLDAIASPQQHRRLFQHRGAVHSLVVLYRASLAARGWKTPTYIRMLHRSATQIQAVVRGHFGRLYANWFREVMSRAVVSMQRLWRGKLGKKMWRALIEERQQLRRVQEESDRAALIAQKQTAHHALAAFERETQHAVVLQRWFRTMRNRQVFREARDRRVHQARTRATNKVNDILRLSTSSVVFQAGVWRDCVDRKSELSALEEKDCVAIEMEIEQLKEACVEAHAGSAHASREFVELSKRKGEFERSRARRKRSTDAVKQRIQPFAVRAKQLTLESARELAANRQMQIELRRIRSELKKFHSSLRGRLAMEPLLLSGDVEELLAKLIVQDEADDGSDDTQNVSTASTSADHIVLG